MIQDTLEIGQKNSIVPRAWERANERSGARAKQAVRSKQGSERCEQTSERMSEWLIMNSFVVNAFFYDDRIFLKI